MPRKRRPVQSATAPGGQAYGAGVDSVRAQQAIPLADELAKSQQNMGATMPATVNTPATATTPGTGGSIGAQSGQGQAQPPGSGGAAPAGAAPPPDAHADALGMPAVGGLFANMPGASGAAMQPPPPPPPRIWVQMALATGDTSLLRMAQDIGAVRD